MSNRIIGSRQLLIISWVVSILSRTIKYSYQVFCLQQLWLIWHQMIGLSIKLSSIQVLDNSSRPSSNNVLEEIKLSLMNNWDTCQILCYGLMMIIRVQSTELTKTPIFTLSMILPTDQICRNIMLRMRIMWSIGMATLSKGHTELLRIKRLMMQE